MSGGLTRLHSLCNIRIVQNDENIAAAELQRGLLEHFGGTRSHPAASAFRARQRYTLDSSVTNQRRNSTR